MVMVTKTAVPGYPRLDTEHKDVAPGSPLAVVGLWLKALRYRFQTTSNDTEPLPWTWGKTLQDCTTNSTGLTKVLIEAAWNVEKAQRNYRPGIYVEYGRVVPQKVIIDNKAGERLPDGFKAYHTMAAAPITITVEAESAAEAALIGDTVWMFVMATLDIFRAAFGFHDISLPQLGEVRPRKTDKDVWVTTVDFVVQFDLRWTTRPLAPLLEEISTVLSTENIDLTVYLNKIALQDPND